jgi:hypothetical protein
MKTISKEGKVDWGDEYGMREGAPAAIFPDGTWGWYLPEALTTGRYLHMTAQGELSVIKVEPDPERGVE